MIVDDVRVMQVQIREILRPFGFRSIRTFSNTEEAKAALEAEPYHLCIVDLHMTPITGYDFLKWVREHPRLKDLAFIMVTVDGVADRVKEVVSIGVDDYILKPLNGTTMIDRIISILERKGMLQ